MPTPLCLVIEDLKIFEDEYFRLFYDVSRKDKVFISWEWESGRNSNRVKLLFNFGGTTMAIFLLFSSNPKSAAEWKMREMERRKKKGTYEVYLIKQRERMKLKRWKDKEAANKLPLDAFVEMQAKKKAKERERKVRCRSRKKMNSSAAVTDKKNSPSENAYMSTVSY